MTQRDLLDDDDDAAAAAADDDDGCQLNVIAALCRQCSTAIAPVRRRLQRSLDKRTFIDE